MLRHKGGKSFKFLLFKTEPKKETKQVKEIKTRRKEGTNTQATH